MRGPYRELNFSAHRIQIRIEGFRIDKLLDKAMKQGLDMRNVRFISELQATCWLTPHDLKKLKMLAKSVYKITELSHKGTEYRLKKFIKEPLKIAGIFIVLFLVIGQSFFVKTIEVNGYRAIPEEELRKALQDMGVREGSYRPGIDWQKAEEHIYETFPQVTWLSLVFDGRKVCLTIAETGEGIRETAEDERTDRGIYSNIVAAKSGYIESISTYRGLELVEAGEYVEKGQVLVTGYVPTKPTVFEEGWQQFYFVKAQSRIIGKVPYRITFNQERYVRGEKEGEKFVSNKKEKTEEQIKEKVNQQIRQWTKENLPQNAQILNKSLNFSYKENIIEVGVTLEVRQQIGEEQEIPIGQEGTDTSGS